MNNQVANQSTEVTYKFSPYDPQLPITVSENERVVKCLYKETVDKVTKKVKRIGINSYIKIPTSHMTNEVVEKEIKALAPLFVAYLQAEEDKIIKEAHKTGSIGFGVSYFGLSKVVEFIESELQGSRLNSEAIHAWFDEEVEELLIIAFADKLKVSATNPTDAELAKLKLISEAYKNKFGSLASGKTHYKEEEAKLLQRALEVTGAKSSVLGGRLYSRLEGMSKAVNNDILEAL